MGWAAGRRARRLVRVLSRARQVPPRFLLRKAAATAALPCWNTFYSLHATRPTSVTHRLATWLSPPQHVALAALATLASRLAPPGDMDGELLRRADKALQNKVRILGYGELDLGPDVDWHRDHVSGFVWPLRPAAALDYVQTGRACDVKVVWELNRLQMLFWLAQGYRMTSDHAYVDHLDKLLAQWSKANPVGMGIAWSCAMDVAIRGLNMAYAAALSWDGLHAATREAVGVSLREHLTFLLRHPEVSDVNGNHYVADLMGSVGLAALLGAPNGAGTPLNRDICRFLSQLDEQIESDGGHHEHALGYHRLVAEMVLHVAAALTNAGHRVPTTLMETLEVMIRFCEYLADDNGLMPVIGDADSGQVVRFDASDFNSLDPLRALWSGVRGEPAVVGASGHAQWLVRPLPLPLPLLVLDGTTLKKRSETFEASGFVVLIDEDSRVVARAGRPGLGGRGAHDHADHTHFVADLGGLPVIVDPGCSSYTGDAETRRREISGSEHNLLVLDGREPFPVVHGSVMDVITPLANSRVEQFCAREKSVVMSHNGYVTAEAEPLIRRAIRLDGPANSLLCEDSVGGLGTHSATISLLLSPEWRPESSSDPSRLLLRHERNSSSLRIDAEEGVVNAERASVSYHYGSSKETTVAKLSYEVVAPGTVSFRLTVNRKGTPTSGGQS